MGFVDNQQTTEAYGYPICGNDEWLSNYKKPIHIVLSMGDTNIRKWVSEKFLAHKNVQFPNIVSHDAVLEYKQVTMGIGNIITAGCILTTNIRIGNFVMINLASTISHDSLLADYITISPGIHIAGNTTIDSCVYFGIGSNLIQGKTIGAGAVVVSNIPAKPIKKRGIQ